MQLLSTLLNPGAVLVAQLLKAKMDALPQEPASYTDIAEVLSILKAVSGLNQVQLAERLGVSAALLSKAENSRYEGDFQAPLLKIMENLARDCNLTVMVEHLKMLGMFARNKRRRGPPKEKLPYYMQPLDRDRKPGE